MIVPNLSTVMNAQRFNLSVMIGRSIRTTILSLNTAQSDRAAEANHSIYARMTNGMRRAISPTLTCPEGYICLQQLVEHRLDRRRVAHQWIGGQRGQRWLTLVGQRRLDDQFLPGDVRCNHSVGRVW